MACHTLLSKLELRGYITLPRRRSPGCRKVSIPYVAHKIASIACALSALKPVQVQLVEVCPERSRRDIGLLDLFQCLAFPVPLSFVSVSTLGENLKSLVFDREQNPLASPFSVFRQPGSVLLVMTLSALYAKVRKDNLQFLTHNLRFLILPWVGFRTGQRYLPLSAYRKISRGSQPVALSQGKAKDGRK